jgi:hypothetical protein
VSTLAITKTNSIKTTPSRNFYIVMFYSKSYPQLYTRTYSLAQIHKLADERFDFRSNPDLACIDLGKSIDVYD